MSAEGFDPADNDSDFSASGPRRPARHPHRVGMAVLWTAVAIVVLGVAFVAAALYTDRSEYCQSCHEMKPYFAAWSVGRHSNVPCIGCHVAPGMMARLGHKFVALGEVRSHFTGDTEFPRAKRPDVPDSRCTGCHRDMPAVTATGFPHGAHAKRGTCASCHPNAGHSVLTATLQAAGIYRAVPPATIPSGSVAAYGAGTANVPGHVETTCSNCHDLEKTGCAACHKPKHEPRGACGLCHRAGAKWVFVHPKADVDCASCHKDRPKGHVSDGDCLNCHNKPGVTWMYTHKPGEDCERCHTRPKGHRAGACDGCHKRPGTSWAFTHPAASANCRTCHQPPANHYSGNCSRCHHKVGVSFAFSHPSAGEHSWRSRPCAKCHPSGGSAVYCTCHNGRPPSD